MLEVILKRFEQPDETRTFEKGRFEVVRLGGMTIGRATYARPRTPTRKKVHDAARSMKRISKTSRGRSAEKNRSLRKNYRSQYSSKEKTTPPLFV
jgi:hypothetical protein